MATPSIHPHRMRGAVYLQTGDVQPDTEYTTSHNIPGRTILIQAAYYATENRTDRSLDDITPADIAPETANIEAESGRIHLKPTTVAAGTYNLSLDAGTTTAASSSQTSPGAGADGNTNTYWYNSSSESPTGAWWGITTAAVETVLSVELVWYNTSYVADFALQTSNDGTTWNTEESFTGVYGAGTQLVTLAAAATSSRFRLLFSNPNNATYVVIREIRIQRADGTGYPTGPLYATTAASLNSSNWEAGVAFDAVVAESPGTTSVRFLVSVDARATWQYWDGAAWAAGALTSAAWGAASNDIGGLRGLTPANWAALIGAGGTFDLAVQMESSSSTQTPSIGNIEFSYTTGTFRKIAGDNEVELRQYDDGVTLGVKNVGAVPRDFFVTIIAIPQPQL